jgi:hypothetical protein
LKAQPGPWRVLAIDPDGAEIGLHEQSLRMEFQTPVFTAAALRTKFAELAYEARTLRGWFFGFRSGHEGHASIVFLIDAWEPPG